MYDFIMIAGFLLAAYSVVANDAIQTLGTFLSSNEDKPWWALWTFTCTILTITLVYGWYANGGDASYGKLDKILKSEQFEFSLGARELVFLIPPIVLMIVTRLGIPVSTTFLIISCFSPKSLPTVLTKSFIGYLLAFTIGLLVYLAISKTFEKRVSETEMSDEARIRWTVLQWISTGFLWSMWLVQDMANIFVYLGKDLGVGMMIFSLIVLILLHGVLFYYRGGSIQKVVKSKTNTSDIRSATVVDFIYATILLLFKLGYIAYALVALGLLDSVDKFKIPMSTTWVFVGLLAGREIGISFANAMNRRTTFRMVGSDFGKITLGLVISAVLVVVLQYVRTGEIASFF